MPPGHHLIRDSLGPHCDVNLDGNLDGNLHGAVDFSKGRDIRSESLCRTDSCVLLGGL